jgi:hypothetical protein
MRTSHFATKTVQAGGLAEEYVRDLMQFEKSTRYSERQKAALAYAEAILVTHVGSLLRGDRLNDLLIGAEGGEEIDPRALEAEIESRVGEVIRRQLSSGIDTLSA